MENWIVDRIEENYIILENNEIVMNISKEEIEFDVKEGDILTKNIDGKFIKNISETLKREEYIKELTQDLWEN